MNLFFIIVFGCLLIFAICFDYFTVNKQAKNIFIIVLCAIFCINSMFRETADTESYKIYYYEIEKLVFSSGFFSEYISLFEVGFEYFTKVLVMFRVTHYGYFLIISVLQCILFYNLVKKCKMKLSLFVLYFSFFGLYFSYTILRAGFSVLFFANAVLSKGAIRKIGLFVLAFYFHSSAIFAIFIFAILYFIKKPIPFKAALVIILLASIFRYSGLLEGFFSGVIMELSKHQSQSLLIKRLLNYIVTMDFSAGLIGNRMILWTIIYLIGNYYIGKFKVYRDDKSLSIVNNVLFVGVILNALLGGNTVISRLTDFMLIFIVFYPILILEIVKNKRKYILLPMCAKCEKQRCVVASDVLLYQCAIISLLVVFQIVFIFRII